MKKNMNLVRKVKATAYSCKCINSVTMQTHERRFYLPYDEGLTQKKAVSLIQSELTQPNEVILSVISTADYNVKLKVPLMLALNDVNMVDSMERADIGENLDVNSQCYTPMSQIYAESDSVHE